jgi:hypothetical protein
MPSDQTTLDRFFIILFRWGLRDYSIRHMRRQSILYGKAAKAKTPRISLISRIKIFQI